MTPDFRRATLLLVFVACLTGCNRGVQMVPVSGKVVFDDGGVVTSGVIEFTTADNLHTARSRIGPDGTFRLGTRSTSDGAVTGRHRVIVTQIVLVEGVPAAGHAPHGIVHEKYADYATSGLTAEVPSTGVSNLVITVSHGASGK